MNHRKSRSSKLLSQTLTILENQPVLYFRLSTIRVFMEPQPDFTPDVPRAKLILAPLSSCVERYPLGSDRKL